MGIERQLKKVKISGLSAFALSACLTFLEPVLNLQNSRPISLLLLNPVVKVGEGEVVWAQNHQIEGGKTKEHPSVRPSPRRWKRSVSRFISTSRFFLLFTNSSEIDRRAIVGRSFSRPSTPARCSNTNVKPAKLHDSWIQI